MAPLHRDLGVTRAETQTPLGVDARTTALDLQLSPATIPTCDQLETLAITSRSHSNIAKWGAELSFRRQVDTSPSTVEGTR